MKITVQSSKSIKPVYGSCGRHSSISSFDATGFVPLTVFDKVTVDVYVSRIYFFRPPAPPTSAMEAGLSRALAEHREWAGRLGVDAATGSRGIILSDAGERFVEATADVALDSVVPWEPTPETTGQLHPRVVDGDGADDLMLLQFTRFACGSFTISTTAHHQVGDGPAVRSFVVAWGQATRGAAVDPVPVHDRVSLFVPRDPPRVEFQHRGAEFKRRGETAGNASPGAGGQVVMVHRAHFTREMISELRSRASSSVGGGRSRRPYTTLQCVVAHLWQCITKARRIDADADTTATELHIAVNGRARMRRPRLPDGYNGNAVLWARPRATAGDLVSMPLGQVVELLRREVSRIDDAYFRSFIDFANSGAVEDEQLVPTADASETAKSPHAAVYSVLGSPFHEVDFGAGQPFFFMPGYVPVEGLVAVVPSFCNDGSIDAYVSLFSHNVDDFKTCWYSSLAAAGTARL